VKTKEKIRGTNPPSLFRTKDETKDEDKPAHKRKQDLSPEDVAKFEHEIELLKVNRDAGRKSTTLLQGSRSLFFWNTFFFFFGGDEVPPRNLTLTNNR